MAIAKGRKRAAQLSAQARARGKLGGMARASKLTPERRREIARKAGQASMAKKSAEERKAFASQAGKKGNEVRWVKPPEAWPFPVSVPPREKD